MRVKERRRRRRRLEWVILMMLWMEDQIDLFASDAADGIWTRNFCAWIGFAAFRPSCLALEHRRRRSFAVEKISLCVCT